MIADAGEEKWSEGIAKQKNSVEKGSDGFELRQTTKIKG